MRSRLAAGLLAVGLLGGACTGAEKVDDPNPIPSNNVPADPDAWTCSGNLVPPTGWLQETAFVNLDEPNAAQKAVDLARGRLVSRLCGGASNCDGLASRIDPWKQGNDATRACAMVTIKSASVEEWRQSATSLQGLDEALDGAARELLAGITKKSPAVAIDKVIDSGVPGGERAEWLATRMSGALTRSGARVVPIPASWNGKGLPAGIDGLVSARAFERLEGQKAVVEVTWVALVGGGGTSLTSAKAVIFPVDAAPSMGSAVTLFPPNDPGLSVRVTSRHAGGGLCIGEKTEVWLSSDADLEVRVFDLYGNGGNEGAFLIFPNPDHPDGRIRKGESLSLGEFKAVPAPGSEVERFLVIGSAGGRDLGRFKSWSGYCRAPSDVASQLHDGKGLPKGSRLASDGFRLLNAEACSTTVSDAERKELLDQLQSFPDCH